ncbi:NAD-dependent epimerase/dehydratase family protein [Candidatus Pelagibacter sp.]|nr:NAD-dependent epimerase/dehydratase family protein [Candidatus Pelagibacter sp.]
MIVITGGAGFIGSTLAKTFLDKDLIIIDMFNDSEQKIYLNEIPGARLVNLKDCKSTLNYFKNDIEYFYHLGANSSTEQTVLGEAINSNIFWSQFFWDFCTNNKIPFMYASSAATYGDGSKGFSDNMTIDELKDIKIHNVYGWSKMYFDIFVLNQEKFGFTPPIWHGLKFFNVYGVNEFHKKKQSSVVHTFLKQLKSTGKIQLFKSLNKNFLDGEQKRDFVSVNFCIEFMKNIQKLNFKNSLLNIGTGQPKTFISFANDIMSAYNQKGKVEFIDMPQNLQKHYQYFTKSENKKTRKIHELMIKFNYTQDLIQILKKIENRID